MLKLAVRPFPRHPLCQSAHSLVRGDIRSGKPCPFPLHRPSYRVLFDRFPSQDQSTTFTIPELSHIPHYLIDLLDLLLPHFDFSHITNNHFFTDTISQKLGAVHAVFNYCMTATCVSEEQKAAVFGRFGDTIAPAMGDIVYSSTLYPHLTRLMGKRALEGPKEEWRLADEAVTRALRESKAAGHPTAEFALVLEVLEEEAWGNDGDSLRVCSTLLDKA